MVALVWMLAGCNGVDWCEDCFFEDPCESNIGWSYPEEGAVDVPWDAAIRLGLQECGDLWTVTLEETETGVELPSTLGGWSPMGQRLELETPLSPSTAYTLTFAIGDEERSLIRFTTGAEPAPPPPIPTVEMSLGMQGCSRSDGFVYAGWSLTGQASVEGADEGVLVRFTTTVDAYPWVVRPGEVYESGFEGNPIWFADVCLYTTVIAVDGEEGEVVATCEPIPPIDESLCEGE